MSRTEHLCPYDGAKWVWSTDDFATAQWCGGHGWLCDMCKRDYELAGRAMQGLLANPGDADAKEVARLATLHADALLAELVQGKKES